MRNVLFILTAIILLQSCMKAKKVDLIIHNAVIYTMDDNNTKYEAMAIKDGVIVELGPERQILNKYRCDEKIDAQGKDIYPGLTDAHVHLHLAAKQRAGLDVSQSKSLEQMITSLEIYQQQYQRKIVVAQGWNEALWRDNQLPTNEKLNTTFPSTPVCLFRYDGHTALVNDAMLKLAGLTAESVIEGGEIQKIDGKTTGIVTDAAMEIVKAKLPSFTNAELKEKIIEIQNELLMYGITNVHDAGLEAQEVKNFIELIDANRLKINIYGMLLPTKENINFAKKNKVFQHQNLSIRSFKTFVDGSLGGYGAYLKQPYSDRPSTSGHATITKEKLDSLVALCTDLGYQLNAHAIGDQAVKMVLEAFKNVSKDLPDHRFRLEHAQVIDPNDLPLIAQYGVFASVQPTHAVSDYTFAEQRLGKDRLTYAYAYQTMLSATGMLAIGSDYPIESMDPFRTIYAATMRKNDKNQPAEGFIPNEALSLEECLRGMTVWAAFASFNEFNYGRLEKGMPATFAVFDRKINVPSNFYQNFALRTFINGKLVYTAD